MKSSKQTRIRRKSFHQNMEKLWPGVSDIVLTAQIIFKGVYRWSRLGKGVRQQDVLQHSYSITILARIITEKLSYYLNLDKDLINTAFLVHDHGEGELKRDICSGDKNKKGNDDDLREYFAFVKRYGKLEPEIFHVFHRAFLLQFCLKDHNGFPEEAIEIMEGLALTSQYEALTFRAVELMEYVLYSMEQDKKGNRPGLLLEVYDRNFPELEEIMKELPGFSEEIWTEEVSAFFEAYLKK
jgi:5'-deoxynucleotidase YfbR-like HD superfamily hydrolase